MSTEYIVKFSKNIENYFGTSDPVDGFVELNPATNTSRVPTISVRTCKESTHKDNISLLFKFITSNFSIWGCIMYKKPRRNRIIIIICS